jgi:SEA/GATOR complex protein SEA3/WDR59
MSCSRSGEYCLIFALREVPVSPHLIDFSERESELLYSFVPSEQLVMHVLAYAEVLFRWRLLHKRIELLKAVDPFLRMPPDSYFNSDHSQLGTPFVLRMCLVTYHVVVGQGHRSCALSAVNRQLLVLNQLALPVAPVSECPDALYAAFLSKACCVHSRPASFFLTQQLFLGLSFNCLGCRHVSHLSCWKSRQSATCTTGCSCRCRAIVQT